MDLSLSLSLAWRYLTYRKKDSTIALMIKVCFLGILIGTFSLMLTLIIFSGFEEVIHEKIQGINAQVIIGASGEEKLDEVETRKRLLGEFPREVEAVSASSIKQLILDRDGQQNLIFVKGVEPLQAARVTNIGEKILGKGALEEILKGDGLLIGHKLAKSFGIKKGDEISLLIPEASRHKDQIFLSKRTARIGGIFNVGLDEYDSGFAFCSLEFLREIFEGCWN